MSRWVQSWSKSLCPPLCPLCADKEAGYGELLSLSVRWCGCRIGQVPPSPAQKATRTWAVFFAVVDAMKTQRGPIQSRQNRTGAEDSSGHLRQYFTRCGCIQEAHKPLKTAVLLGGLLSLEIAQVCPHHPTQNSDPALGVRHSDPELPKPTASRSSSDTSQCQLRKRNRNSLFVREVSVYVCNRWRCVDCVEYAIA